MQQPVLFTTITSACTGTHQAHGIPEEQRGQKGEQQQVRVDALPHANRHGEVAKPVPRRLVDHGDADALENGLADAPAWVRQSAKAASAALVELVCSAMHVVNVEANHSGGHVWASRDTLPRSTCHHEAHP